MDTKGSINLEDVFEYCENKDKHKKHLKGYIYDSLVYRYQLARYTQADLEAERDCKPTKTCRRAAERDIMRFIQILNEAIGEHD